MRRQMQENCDNISRGIKEFMRGVMISSTVVLAPSCPSSGIFEESKGVIVGLPGHRDLSAGYPDYLWCSCCAQSSVEHFDHTSCACRLSFAELEFQFSIPLQSFTNQTLSEGQLMCCCESPTERISSYCLSSGIIP